MDDRRGRASGGGWDRERDGRSGSRWGPPVEPSPREWGGGRGRGRRSGGAGELLHVGRSIFLISTDGSLCDGIATMLQITTPALPHDVRTVGHLHLAKWETHLPIDHGIHTVDPKMAAGEVVDSIEAMRETHTRTASAEGTTIGHAVADLFLGGTPGTAHLPPASVVDQLHHLHRRSMDQKLAIMQAHRGL